MSSSTSNIIREGRLFIEDKSIVALAVELRHPIIQLGFERNYFELINAAELYGIMRHRSIGDFIATVTDPIYVCTAIRNPQHDDFFSISWIQYHRFLTEYVGRVDEGKESRWLSEGF